MRGSPWEARRPVAYTHVPTFRFPTPPRAARADAAPAHQQPPGDGVQALGVQPDDGEPEWLSRASRELEARAAAEAWEGGPAAAEAAPRPSATGAASQAAQAAAPLAVEPPSDGQRAGATTVPGSMREAPFGGVPPEAFDEFPASVQSLASLPEDGRGREAKAGEPPTLPVHANVLATLAQAYDESVEEVQKPLPGVSGFRWTGVMDAAQAAWIGGTRMLRYGELLPGGLSRALDLMTEGQRGGADGAGEGAAAGQLALELGMGRGRVALQLFLSGATVIGVELANERYGLAVAALERLAHRCPEHFEISRRTASTVRIRRVGGPKAAICELRLGNFFDVVTGEEVEAATLLFMQVCLPQPAWPRLRSLLLHTQAGCRILMYENLRKMWEGGNFPFDCLGDPHLSCSWAPERGHRFHCYLRGSAVPAPAAAFQAIVDAARAEGGAAAQRTADHERSA
mmetsp:Transcript_43676/g.135909  ORF Transcript_43676/g.135909 Transcript_43676/m.135909 type:complete len:457 (-) Transcript_43676:2-1372(-)